MSNALRGTAVVLVLVLAGFSATHHVEDASPVRTDIAIADTHEVKEVDWAGQTYIGLRDTVAFDAMNAFYDEHLGTLYSHLETSGVEPAGAATGLYWTWNEDEQTTVMAAAVPVPEGTTAPEGYEVIEIPAGTAYGVDYYGDYENMMPVHEQISAYIEENDLNDPQVVIEEYITDAQTEPDTSKWHTRIVYVLRDEM